MFNETIGKCLCCLNPFDDYSLQVRCMHCRLLILVCPTCNSSEDVVVSALLCETCKEFRTETVQTVQA